MPAIDVDLIEDGLTGIGDSDDDYVFGDAIGIPDLLPVEDAYIPKANQRTMLDGQLSSFCTGINPFRTGLSLDNHEMPLTLLQEYWDYCKKNYGYVSKKWNLASKWVDAARNFLKAIYPKTPLLSFKVNMLSPDHLNVLNKWYKTIVCYDWSTAYNKDYRKDNVLDGNAFWDRTYGHCTVLKSENKILKIDDSYDGTPYNIYTIKDMPGLIKSKTFYLPTYFFVRDPNGAIYSKQMAYEEEKRAALKRAISSGVTNGESMTAQDYRYLVRLYRVNK